MAKGCAGCIFLETWNKQFKSKCFRQWNAKKVNTVTKEVFVNGCKHKQFNKRREQWKS